MKTFDKIGLLMLVATAANQCDTFDDFVTCLTNEIDKLEREEIDYLSVEPSDMTNTQLRRYWPTVYQQAYVDVTMTPLRNEFQRVMKERNIEH